MKTLVELHVTGSSASFNLVFSRLGFTDGCECDLLANMCV